MANINMSNGRLQAYTVYSGKLHYLNVSWQFSLR